MLSKDSAEEFSRHCRDAAVSLQKALNALGPSKRFRKVAHSGLAHTVRGALLRIANIRRIYPSYSYDGDLGENTWEGWKAKIQKLAGTAENALTEIASLLQDPRLEDLERARQARLEADRAHSILQEVMLQFAKISQPRADEVISPKRNRKRRR